MLDFLKGAFAPILNLIDEFHTSGEEKAAAKLQVMQLQADLELKAMEFDARLAEARSRVIEAEATSESWITRSWRPVTMLTFLGIIVYQAIVVSIFGTPAIDVSAIPAEMWNLLKIGIGGYLVSRGAEKVVANWRNGEAK